MMAKPLLYVGIDLGGTNIGAAVVDAEGRVLNQDPGELRTRTKAELGAEGVVDRIVKLVGKAVDDAGLKLQDIEAIGIGAPGTCDLKRGVVTHAVNLRWTDVPLGEMLSKQLEGLPVVVDNDVNVAAWGEYKAGAAKGQDDLLAVWCGTGVGGGLVLDGKLYHGARMTAGEVGQTIIHANEVLGRKTLEQSSGRASIVSQLMRLVDQHYESSLSETLLDPEKKVGSKKLAGAYAAGDRLVVEIVDQAAYCVGAAVASQVTMLSLPCVVLGGGVTEAFGSMWVERVQEAFQGLVHPPYLSDCKIVASELEDLAGIVGAGLLAAERL